MSAEMNQRFMRLPEVKSVSGLSRSHIYDLISRGEFPSQYKLSGRVSGWLESEIRDWVAVKINQKQILKNSLSNFSMRC